MQYTPDMESLKKHQAPEWFHDAKLGIFIHWGLYSVPAFAPVDYGSISDIIPKYGWKFHFSHNPYAEWYLNSIRINEEPYKSFHRENYGENFRYDEFAPIFNDELKKWNPKEWANLFNTIGAKYVVITTKHHDGFLLWPSKTRNPEKLDYVASRNIVGELTSNVKEKGLKMGLYYSGALDWSFQENPIRETTSMIGNGPITQEYAEYVDNHMYELIDEFEPDILWNDIAYPKKGKMFEIIAHFFNKKPDVTVNDRWTQIPSIARFLQKTFILKKIINYIAKKLVTKEGVGGGTAPPGFADYKTPEYMPHYELTEYKWESCRGIGQSFGYNRNETEEHYLSLEDLIISFIDIVSKNGNLLLNIGPKPDGSIPEIQMQRLLGLGKWLEKNGDGLFGTRPWKHATGQTEDEFDVRFTQKGDSLYVFILGIPDNENICIKELKIKDNSKISLLGSSEDIKWEQDGQDLNIIISKKKKEEIAIGFKITPKP